VIAVDMPNNQSVNSLSWGSYRTTVDAIETATGYNLLPNLPASVQNTLEAAVDNGPTQ
jgi:endonuclease G